MLRRATDLAARARERIRIAREHDPHAWQHHADGDEPEPIDFVDIPSEDDEPGDVSLDRAPRPPLGSPEPGAPDLDGPVGAGGVSGPPQGGRPLRPGERNRRQREDAARRPEDTVPAGLRIAAAWSWRLILVLVALYALVNAAAYIAVVVIPVIVALLLAALLQPAPRDWSTAAGPGPWPPSPC